MTGMWSWQVQQQHQAQAPETAGQAPPQVGSQPQTPLPTPAGTAGPQTGQELSEMLQIFQDQELSMFNASFE